MNNKSFTINDLERFSGIKAHTLRIWERRYALLLPNRTQGNFRLYTLDQLKKVLDISLLNKNGYRISDLSSLTSNEIEKKIASLIHDNHRWQKAINELTISMYTQEPEAFEWMLEKLLQDWPIETVMEKIIYPFLETTSLLWVGNKLCEEHLVVTSIRKKIILAIETTGSIVKQDKSVLLFLPDTKQLDLGLLFVNYFLKKRGVHVLYMGNDVTMQNLKNIFHVHPITIAFTYLQQQHHFPVKQLLDYMNIHLPDAKLIIGSYSVEYSLPILSSNLLQVNFSDALDYMHLNGK